MPQNVAEILSHDFNEVIANGDLVIKLMRSYSNIYLNGKPCGSCVRSLNKYYTQLKLDGIKKKEIMIKNLSKTCMLKSKGLVSFRNKKSNMIEHVSNETITDEYAIDLIESGSISKEKFSVLPESLGTKEISTEPKEKKLTKAEKKCIEEFRELFQNDFTEDEIFEDYKDIEKIGNKKIDDEYLKELISKAK